MPAREGQMWDNNNPIAIPGYELVAEVYESAGSLVYRGRRHQDDLPVILKFLKQEYPSPEQISRFKLEYEITRRLNLPGVVKPYSLEKYQNTLVMVLEDFGGESLNKLMRSRQFSLLEFLAIGIQVAEILGQIHQHNIIHKDINPAHIILHSETEQVKVIDFGISTVLSRQNPTLRNPNLFEGTLAYMSPEQTGRMNRAIDYRTDFYSLGATFYEILTRQLPFPTLDAIELVHCHIAKQPIPPGELNPVIPQSISDIVMKLLAKNAEDRYQSAWGLKADLETCFELLQSNRNISTFPLAKKDFSDKLQISEKLYGREREIDILLAAFERVTGERLADGENQPGIEVLLVAGYSGIGKSALVEEIYKPITSHRGYFISGKFDQFHRNIPYSAIIQALQELVRQLLTESEADIALWREKFLAALGVNGQIIIDVIPEVEVIIGKQPQVPLLGATESQNRFNLVFQNFIKVFTKPEHPLVIFLDDLQWSDSATLKLIELIATDADTQYLFLIGAYRDNEVSTVHPLMVTLEAMQKAGVKVNSIALQPLGLETVNQLIAETLHSQPELTELLAEVVFYKTYGNPFFVNQILRLLYEEEALKFDWQKLIWVWDIAHITRMSITDNVVDLMVSKIQKLGHNTQDMLQFGACIGNQFNLTTLSEACETSVAQTAITLWSAVEEGLIMPIEGNFQLVVIAELEPQKIAYQFLHDRVQQAAYSLIAEDEKKAVHLKIGRLLLEKTSAAEREEKIFDIVNQLNRGFDLIVNPEEKIQLAELNLVAGRKAKASAAYEPALKYLRLALEFLSADSWQKRYDLTLNAYVEAAEAEYLNTNFERAEILANVVWQKAANLIDKVKVCELKIQLYMAELQPLKSIDTGLAVLEMLGVSLESFPSQGSGEGELPEIDDKEVILEMTDPYKLMAMQILTNIAIPAYTAKPEIYPQVILTQIKLCKEYGYSSQAALAYCQYGAFLGVIGNISSAYLAGKMGLKLLERFNAKQLKAKVDNLFNSYIRYWQEHLRETKAGFLEAFHSGMETGDIESASYSLMNYCTYLFLMGEPLEVVEQQQAQYLQVLLKLKQNIAISVVKVWRQLTLNLRGNCSDKYCLIGESFDETEMLPHLRESNNQVTLFCTFFAKTILFYLGKDYAAAVANAELAAESAPFAIGWMPFTVHKFYYSLSLLAQYPQMDEIEQQKYLYIVEENQQKLREWANVSPANFQHKYDLLEAEKARVLGQAWQAMEYYDRAIQGARERGYIQEEALAYELAADFYFSKGREEVGRTYFKKAYYYYLRWGATSKVEDLKSNYLDLIPRNYNSEKLGIQSSIDTTVTTNNGDSAALDLASAIKASQAISGEIELDKLLAKLMKILIENAGAQKGLLILETKGKLLIEAEGIVDGDIVKVLRSIPIDGATGASTLLPRSVVNYVRRTKESVVLNNASSEGKFVNDPYIIDNQPKSILCVPSIEKGQLISIAYLENNLTVGAFTPERVEVITLLSSQAAISIENAKLYSELRAFTDRLYQLNKAYERFVPRQFLQFLNKESIVDVELGDNVQQEMSVLFADIRDFTTISETMTPEDNFKFINAYLSRMEPAIIDNNGFIDKYIGDAIMALFSGAADDAVKAAIAMLQILAEYNLTRSRPERLPINIGIGINTGYLMLGTVGGRNRMDGTVISDSVNLASRIEGLTKNYGVSLLIAHNTFMRLQNRSQYAIRTLDRVKVKGKSEVVTVYEVFDADPAEIKQRKLATAAIFEEAFALYHQQLFSEAKKLFELCLAQNPLDKVTQIYLERCQQHHTHN